jgi:hypothetical protein
MINDTYYIDFLNGGKSITIQPEDLDNSTPLQLVGKNSTDWGKHLNANLLHILENFKSPSVPMQIGSVLEGQLWYDTNKNQLKLCIDSKNSKWDIICNAESEPLKDYTTISKFNDSIKKYIALDGNTETMTGQLLVSQLTDTSDNSSLATKKYVENKVCACLYDDNDPKILANYVSAIHDDTITSTKVLLTDDTGDDSYCASKKYIDNNVFYGINYSNDVTIEATAQSSPSELLSYVVTSGSEKNQYISGSFIMLKDIMTVDVSWIKPFIGEYYIMVSAGMHDYIKDDTNSGKTDDVYGVKVDDKKITVKRNTGTLNEKIYFMIHGSIA